LVGKTGRAVQIGEGPMRVNRYRTLSVSHANRTTNKSKGAAARRSKYTDGPKLLPAD
jgi:hypothetical protein